MTTPTPRKQEGFVLIIAMILLAVLSLLVIHGVSATTMGEQMAGNHMDRARAQMAAEQALTQGLAVLQTNGVDCLEGCNGTHGTKAKNTTAALVSAWSDTGAQTASNTAWSATSGDPVASAKYSITWQDNTAFDKPDCKAYSVMGRGQGFNSNTVVILQTIAYVCPTE
jgi:type IV pilus assembly protein PilX